MKGHVIHIFNAAPHRAPFFLDHDPNWVVVSTPLKNISQLGWLFPTEWRNKICSKPPTRNGDGSIPIDTIFSGMNIHLPAILMFTRGTRFWHTAKYTHHHLLGEKKVPMIPWNLNNKPAEMHHKSRSHLEMALMNSGCRMVPGPRRVDYGGFYEWK